MGSAHSKSLEAPQLLCDEILKLLGHVIELLLHLLGQLNCMLACLVKLERSGIIQRGSITLNFADQIMDIVRQG